MLAKQKCSVTILIKHDALQNFLAGISLCHQLQTTCEVSSQSIPSQQNPATGHFGPNFSLQKEPTIWEEEAFIGYSVHQKHTATLLSHEELDMIMVDDLQVEQMGLVRFLGCPLCLSALGCLVRCHHRYKLCVVDAA